MPPGQTASSIVRNFECKNKITKSNLTIVTSNNTKSIKFTGWVNALESATKNTSEPFGLKILHTHGVLKLNLWKTVNGITTALLNLRTIINHAKVVIKSNHTVHHQLSLARLNWVSLIWIILKLYDLLKCIVV